MFLRFVIPSRDPDSGKRQGVFQALADLSYEQRLTQAEEILYNDLRRWFNEHLERPDRFSRSSRHNPKNVAISWFKDSATTHISKMREMTAILNAHDFTVEVIQTERPGYIVYEDRYQVCAEPFRETDS